MTVHDTHAAWRLATSLRARNSEVRHGTSLVTHLARAPRIDTRSFSRRSVLSALQS